MGEVIQFPEVKSKGTLRLTPAEVVAFPGCRIETNPFVTPPQRQMTQAEAQRAFQEAAEKGTLRGFTSDNLKALSDQNEFLLAAKRVIEDKLLGKT